MQLSQIMKIQDERKKSHEMYKYSKNKNKFNSKEELFEFISSIPDIAWRFMAIGEFINDMTNFRNAQDRFTFISTLDDENKSSAMFELCEDQDNFSSKQELKQYMLQIPNFKIKSEAISSYLERFETELTVAQKKSLIQKINDDVIKSVVMEEFALNPNNFTNTFQRKEFVEDIPDDIKKSRVMENICSSSSNFDNFEELEHYAFSIPNLEIRSRVIANIRQNFSELNFQDHAPTTIIQRSSQQKQEAKILTLLSSYLNDSNELIPQSTRQLLKKKPIQKFLNRIGQSFTKEQELPQLIQKIQNYKKKLIQQRKKQGQQQIKSSIKIQQLSSLNFDTFKVFDMINGEYVSINDFLRNDDYGKTIVVLIKDKNTYNINGYFLNNLKILYICRSIPYHQYIQKQQTESIYTLFSFTNEKGDCRIKKIDIEDKLIQGFNLFFVEKESDDEFKIISKSAIESMNFVNAIHCDHTTIIYKITEYAKIE